MNFNNRFILLMFFVIALIIGYIIYKIIDKKCSSEMKLLDIFFLILSCIYYIVYFVVCLGPFIPENHYFFKSGLSNALFAIGLIFGTTMYLLMTKSHIDLPKPDKYTLNQDTYELFSWYLSNRLKLFKYKNILKEEKLNVYKKQINQKEYYIIDYKTEKFIDKKFEELCVNNIFPLMEESLKNKDKIFSPYFVYVIYIVSVDSVSNKFNDFLYSLEQDTIYFKLPVGISFDDNKIYISKELKGFETFELEELKTEIKEILEINDKNCD